MQSRSHLVVRAIAACQPDRTLDVCLGGPLDDIGLGLRSATIKASERGKSSATMKALYI